jgi:hypothetical protein
MADSPIVYQNQMSFWFVNGSGDILYNIGDRFSDLALITKLDFYSVLASCDMAAFVGRVSMTINITDKQN